MNDYQKEQLEALQLVRTCLPAIKGSLVESLNTPMTDYLEFRRETDRFLSDYFSGVCSVSCYQNRLSACCSKDGIITFFADVVINALQSDNAELDRIEARLRETNAGFKCIYLAPGGCLWRIKPVVCQMFLCDKAQREVFGGDTLPGTQWEALKERKKDFTWPDKPVLFDRIESIFLDSGISSSLMYFHNSPGLLRVKRQAGPQPPSPPIERLSPREQ